jgi:Tol biopolymer transport system component
MGEVYRARDTRLDRIVAIKILHPDLASSPKFRQRFQREARVISSLNHPHVCTLHDIGHDQGMDYLVMEFLEGETLADRIGKGGLPLNQLLKTAMEVGDALDKAHRHGIVHRDLKPGNVMLTEAGAKLMDFGLARPAAAAVAAADTRAVTVSKPLTEEGAIVGTLQYMAPEQLEGKEADARSDIFSFGAVLYEMATGRRAFEGKTRVSVVAAILEKEPEPISAIKPMMPPALEHVVHTCLAKDPEDRWQSAHDINRELEWIRQSGSQAASAATSLGKGPWLRRHAAWLAAGVLIIAALIGGWLLLSKARTVPASVVHFAVQTPPETPLDESDPGLAVSPDGLHIASLVKTPTGAHGLYLYSLEQSAGKLTPAPSMDAASLFSPDGQWLAFVAAKKVRKMALSGDQLLDVCSLPDIGRRGTWARDGNLYFGILGRGISRVPASGGVPEQVTQLESGEQEHDWPQLLSDGDHLLFTARRRTLGDAIVIQSLKTGKRRIVLENASRGTYIPTGHLLFFRANTLWAVPFDPGRLLTTGPEFILPYHVFTDDNSFWVNPEFTVSQSGTLVYAAARDNKYSVVMVDRAGAVRPLPLPAGDYWDPRLSPDGRFLVVSVKQGPRNSLWLYDLARESPTRLSAAQVNDMVPTWDDMAPTWSPDGRLLVFTRGHTLGGTNLMWMPTDGSAEPRRFYEFPKGFVAATSWSRDAKRLALVEYELGGDKLQVRMLPVLYTPASAVRAPVLQAAAEPATLANASGQAWQAMLSPDARWIAYTSDESARTEVYVRAAEPGGGRWQVSSDGGLQPHWSANGKELYYRIGDKMMAASVVTQPTFSSGRPRVLFEGSLLLGGAVNGYDLTPDGREFLMLRDDSPHRGLTEYKVVLNWFQELKKLEAARIAPR